MNREDILRRVFPHFDERQHAEQEPPTTEELHETTNMLLKQIAVELANLRAALRQAIIQHGSNR